MGLEPPEQSLGKGTRCRGRAQGQRTSLTQRTPDSEFNHPQCFPLQYIIISFNLRIFGRMGFFFSFILYFFLLLCLALPCNIGSS